MQIPDTVWRKLAATYPLETAMKLAVYYTFLVQSDTYAEADRLIGMMGGGGPLAPTVAKHYRRLLREAEIEFPQHPRGRPRK